MTEDNPEQKLCSNREYFAPIAFRSRVFTPAQPKMSIYCKEFVAIDHAFVDYSHFLLESKEPTLVFTDNASKWRFLQTKVIQPAPWNTCDYVLQLNFQILQVPRSMKTGADYLLRLEINPHDRIHLKIRNDIQTQAIELNIVSSDKAEEN